MLYFEDNYNYLENKNYSNKLNLCKINKFYNIFDNNNNINNYSNSELDNENDIITDYSSSDSINNKKITNIDNIIIECDIKKFLSIDNFKKLLINFLYLLNSEKKYYYLIFKNFFNGLYDINKIFIFINKKKKSKSCDMCNYNNKSFNHPKKKINFNKIKFSQCDYNISYNNKNLINKFTIVNFYDKKHSFDKNNYNLKFNFKKRSNSLEIRNDILSCKKKKININNKNKFLYCEPRNSSYKLLDKSNNLLFYKNEITLLEKIKKNTFYYKNTIFDVNRKKNRYYNNKEIIAKLYKKYLNSYKITFFNTFYRYKNLNISRFLNYNLESKKNKKNIYIQKKKDKKNISYGIILISIFKKKWFILDKMINIIKNGNMDSIFKLIKNIKGNKESNDIFNKIKIDQKYKKINFFFKKNLKFLIICRKHSIEFCDVLNGKLLLNHNDKNEIKKIFSYMTENEIELIKNKSFDELWDIIWGGFDNTYSKNHDDRFLFLKKNFEKLKKNIDLEKLQSNYKYCEWSFPKGKKINIETKIECAIREFKEETFINTEDIMLLENFKFFKEIFLGTNKKKYIHEYYIAYTNKEIKFNFDKIKNSSEVSYIKWISFNEVNKYIRDYHNKRKNVFNNIITAISLLIFENYIDEFDSFFYE